jgi:hypothetical protein
MYPRVGEHSPLLKAHVSQLFVHYCCVRRVGKHTQVAIFLLPPFQRNSTKEHLPLPPFCCVISQCTVEREVII